MKKFIIFAPRYDESSGGSIALHKLCHLINEIGGRKAALYPLFENSEINRLNYKKILFKAIAKDINWHTRRYTTNRLFNTPVLRDIREYGDQNEWIAVYPEITFGNPLNAKNVVRWLLHRPGFFTKKISFGTEDYFVRYNVHISDSRFAGLHMAPECLRVVDFPLHLYNLEGTAQERDGTAYCLRKGNGRPIQHDLHNSVLIDGLPHDKIAAIFKRVKCFISYDPYTVYSRLAALCGCDSVVIPESNVSIEKWNPDPNDRLGVAYGFENILTAQTSREALRTRYELLQKNSEINTQKFIRNAEDFFHKRDTQNIG